MTDDRPLLTSKEAKFIQWLDAPEQCCRLYPSVCNGSAVLRMEMAGQWYSLCKPCLSAMQKQMERIFEP